MPSHLTAIGDTMPDDLVLGSKAAEATGVPKNVIWQWANRGKIARFPGRFRTDQTMYSLKQVEAMAETYKATPQRRPRNPRRRKATLGQPEQPLAA